MARMKERKMGPRVALVYLLSVSHIRAHVCVHDPWMNSEMKNSLTSEVWGVGGGGEIDANCATPE